MKALLLSAGLGTRLAPMTKNIPKCLVEINKKPLLLYWMENLNKLGIDEIFINTYYLKKAVIKFVESSDFKNKITLIHEDKLLGTGGTLKKNANLFLEDTFLLIHADNLCLTDFDNS